MVDQVDCAAASGTVDVQYAFSAAKHHKYVQQPIIITSSIDEHKTAEVCYFALTTAKEVLFLVSCVCVCVSVSKTSSSAIAERARDASCLSVVTFNSTTLDGYIL